MDWRLLWGEKDRLGREGFPNGGGEVVVVVGGGVVFSDYLVEVPHQSLKSWR